MTPFEVGCLILTIIFCSLWLSESKASSKIIARLLEANQYETNAKRSLVRNVKHWAAIARMLRNDRDRLEQSCCDLIHANGLLSDEIREVTYELMEMKAARSKSQAALEAKIEARRAIREDRRRKVAELVEKHKSPSFIARKLKASLPTIKLDIRAIEQAKRDENTANAIKACATSAKSFGLDTSEDNKSVTIDRPTTIEVREHRSSRTATLAVPLNDVGVEG